MELNFKQSNISIFQIVETLDGKIYILDTSKTTPKTYGWGFVPKQIRVDMVEIAPDNRFFELKNQSNRSTVWIALAVQPFVKIVYDMMRHFFQDYDISQQIFLKLILFVFSILVSYGLYRLYLRNCYKKVAGNLLPSNKRLTLLFKVSNRRSFDYLYLLIINIVILGAYLLINNGTEGVLLVLNSLVTMVWFIICKGMYSVGTFYANKDFILEGIDEKEGLLG